MIPFIGFAPDIDPTTPGVITDCTNLIPTLKGYAGGPTGVDAGLNALAAAAISAATLIKLDASNRLIAGTTTKLYENSGVAWADVSRNTAATITATIATPAVVTWAAHGLLAGTAFVFTTTGALPTGVAAGTTYYVIPTGLTANTFQFSATSGGAAINTSGTQSGVHTATRTGAAYNASADFIWRFDQFGNTSLAVNKGDVLQYSNSGVFADLAAPKAAVMCVTNGFVMLANTNEATYGDSPERWWCSALYDVTSWVPSISTQCTTGRLVDTPGQITGLRPLGQDIVAYKDRAMYLAQYSGPPGVWSFTLIPGDIGCSSQEAVADIGTAHIFIGFEDIYRFDGARPVPIGAPLREWFFGDLDPSYRPRIKHSHDRDGGLVYFFYPRNGSAGVLNGCIVYNYRSNQWGVAHRTVEAVVDIISGGYTWDTLPITTWDSWPAVAYDSSFWTASSRSPAYIGTDHKIYSLTGASDTCSLTTGDYGEDNQYSLLSRVSLRYLTRPTTAIMTNYYQEIHGGAWTTDAATTEFSGRFDLLISAPWHKAKFSFTGDVELTAMIPLFDASGVF